MKIVILDFDNLFRGIRYSEYDAPHFSLSYIINQMTPNHYSSDITHEYAQPFWF